MSRTHTATERLGALLTCIGLAAILVTVPARPAEAAPPTLNFDDRGCLVSFTTTVSFENEIDEILVSDADGLLVETLTAGAPVGTYTLPLGTGPLCGGGSWVGTSYLTFGDELQAWPKGEGTFEEGDIGEPPTTTTTAPPVDLPPTPPTTTGPPPSDLPPTPDSPPPTTPEPTTTTTTPEGTGTSITTSTTTPEGTGTTIPAVEVPECVDDPTTEEPECELPFTGIDDALMPVGIASIVAGGIAILAARKRGAHEA